MTLVIDKPSASEFAAIVKRTQADTPTTAAVRADIAAIRSAVPDSGPNLLMTDLPSDCKVADSASAALAAHQQLVSTSFHHRGGSTIPNGTYVTTTSVADLRHGEVFGPDWDKAITWTWHLNNGELYETQQPDYPDQGPCRGTYVTRGDVFVVSYTTNCTGVETTRWSYYQGKLTFAVVDVADSSSRVIYTAHPWQKLN